MFFSLSQNNSATVKEAPPFTCNILYTIIYAKNYFFTFFLDKNEKNLIRFNISAYKSGTALPVHCAEICISYTELSISFTECDFRVSRSYNEFRKARDLPRSIEKTQNEIFLNYRLRNLSGIIQQTVDKIHWNFC